MPEGKVLQLMRKFGRNFQRALIFDRVSEHLRKYCADHDIDEVYNEKFLEIPDYVMEKVLEQIGKLSNGSVEILNLVIPKPDIPPDIAENYKRVKKSPPKCLILTSLKKCIFLGKSTMDRTIGGQTTTRNSKDQKEN